MSEHLELMITDAEWEVMESVWQADDQTPAQIIARVQPIRNRSHRTIRTLLVRLVDKGAVAVRIDGSQHLYSAAVTRDACIHAAAESFSERFFSGNLQSLLLHFVQSESLSAAEIKSLQQELDAISQKPTNKTKSRKAKRTRSTTSNYSSA